MSKEETEHKGLEILRRPFPSSQISKLPKPTKQQTEMVKNDFKTGFRCAICGGWHHKDVVHLDYVGHAALTSRLLEADPHWNWEPVAVDQNGLPLFDSGGCLWIKLTVCGVTRLGFGDAEGKKGAAAIKEMIGDALRNSAMRFGAALDQWSKADLHQNDKTEERKGSIEAQNYPQDRFDKNFKAWAADIKGGKRTPEDLIKMLRVNGVNLNKEQTKKIKNVESEKQ